MSYTEDRAAVKRLTREIDRAEADADAWKWERAERLTRMCETKAKREVARDVGMNESTLRVILKVWEGVGAQVPTHQTYTEAYYAVGGQKNFGGGRTLKEKATTVVAAIADAEVAAALTPTQREKVYQALEASETHPVTRPSTAPAKRTTAAQRNISALARLAAMHTAAEEATGLADFGSLSDHQLANAEVALRATESEIAVWRENAGGGISDEAIQAVMAGEA